MAKRVFLIAAIQMLFLVSIVSADIGDTLWTKFYGLGAGDGAFSVKETKDKGFVLAGYINYSSWSDTDFYIVRTNHAGDTLWTRQYGGDQDDQANSIAVTEDGYFIVAGWTASFGAGETDFWVILLDNYGDSLWSHTYGGNGEDSAKCVITTSDNCFVVCGNSEGVEGDLEVHAIKIDTHGTPIWEYSGGGVADDGANCIIESDQGLYYLAGWTAHGSGTKNMYMETLDENGQSLWYRGWRPGSDNWAHSITQTSDGNFVIAGHSYNSNNAIDCYLTKINSNGHMIWEQTYGGDLWELAFSVDETSDDGLIIGGAKWLTLWPDTLQFNLIRTDSEGEVLWERTYGYGTYDEGFSVISTSDGHYAFAGYSNWSGFMNLDMCLMKVQGEGMVDIDERAEMPSTFTLAANYPNPFNAYTIIKYELPKQSQVSIIVYDILGRQVEILVDEFKTAGSYQAVWNTENEPSGVYFYKLIAGEYNETQKMNLIK